MTLTAFILVGVFVFLSGFYTGRAVEVEKHRILFKKTKGEDVFVVNKDGDLIEQITKKK